MTDYEAKMLADLGMTDSTGDTLVDIDKLIARLEDERDELKDCSRVAGQPSALDPVTAQRIANTMYDAMTALESARKEVETLRLSVIAFAGPHAAQYAKDFGLVLGELHPTHYDILERAGARMTDFRRAALSEQAKPSDEATAKQ